MHIDTDAIAVFTFLSIGAIALFSFLALASWSKSRRREKEAYYKNEMIKKIAESPDGAAGALEYLREEEKLAAQKRRESLRIGGLITAAVGMGLLIFLHSLIPGVPVYLVGVILLFIGAAMLAYTYWLAPKE